MKNTIWDEELDIFIRDVFASFLKLLSKLADELGKKHLRN